MATDDQALVEAIGISPIAMVASNPRKTDNPLELVNDAFCTLTGYGENEIIGRNCRFLAGKRTDAAATEQIRSAVRSARPVLVEILNYRRDGTVFRNGVMVSPLFDDEGRIAWFLGSQVDLGPGQSLSNRRLYAAEKLATLPPRQQQVLRLMSHGLLNKQIAWELKISQKTVKMHRALLLERLGLSTSAEAIRLAVEAGY